MAGKFFGVKRAAATPQAPHNDYLSGISATPQGVAGEDFIEEHRHNDPLHLPDRVTYILSTTDIALANTDDAVLYSASASVYGGKAARDATGVIRFKVDRDRQYENNWQSIDGGTLLPAYSAPFSFADLEYEAGVPVVGTTGPNGQPISNRTAHYHRGVSTSWGAEVHQIVRARDDSAEPSIGDPEWNINDGRMDLYIVDPPTPCLRFYVADAGAEFYTTPLKKYFIPKAFEQTTYFTAGVRAILEKLKGQTGAIQYRVDGGGWQSYAGPINIDSLSPDTEHLLEYTRDSGVTIAKRTLYRPTVYPSAGESHGDFMFGHSATYRAAQLARWASGQYIVVLNNWSTTASQTKFDRFADGGPFDLGRRIHFRSAGKAALMALYYGPTASPSVTGVSRSYFELARDGLLGTALRLGRLDAEKNEEDDGVCTRERFYRGYWDALQQYSNAVAYDVLVGHYRADQISGGFSIIQDYLARDLLAKYCEEQAESWGDWNTTGAPKMWGCAEAAASVFTGLVMPSYDTPHHGTSGFDLTTSASHLFVPFPTDACTWRDLWVEGVSPLGSYPDIVYSTERIDGWLFQDQPVTGYHWGDRGGYLANYALMGRVFQFFACAMYDHYSGWKLPELEAAYLSGLDQTLLAAVDPGEYPYPKFTAACFVGDRFDQGEAQYDELALEVEDGTNLLSVRGQLYQGYGLSMCFYDDSWTPPP